MPRRALLRAAVLPALLSATLTVGACGADGDSSSWVGTFCGSGATLRAVVSSRNEALKSGLKIQGLAPEELKSSIVRGAGDVVAASAKAESRIREEGEPSVSQGKEIEATAVARYTAVVQQAQALQSEANGLDATSADSLAAGIGPYSQKLIDLSREVAGSFDELKQFKGYAKLDKVSRTPDDYGTVDSCTELRTVAS